MASTIAPTSLVVSLTESLVLNGSNHGSVHKITISGINEVEKRIFTIPSYDNGGTQIYVGSTAPAAGTYVTANVKYIRITNLDDTGNVILHLQSNTSKVQLLLLPGHIFLLTDVTSAIDNATTILGFTAEDIIRIDAVGDSIDVDIEMMVASSSS